MLKTLAIALGFLDGILLYPVCHRLLVPPRAGSNVSRAKMDTKIIEKAVVSYRVKNGTYPPNLEMLTRGQGENGPLLEPAILIDPWGNPYHYRPDVPNPNTKYPLIYSDGPPWHGPPIRNWTDQGDGESVHIPVPRRSFWADPANVWALIALVVLAAPLVFLLVVWFVDGARQRFDETRWDGTWTCALAQMMPWVLAFAMIGGFGVAVIDAVNTSRFLD